LTARVRPGVELVRAKPFFPNSRLRRLDLPTFERPTKRSSGRPSRRRSSLRCAERTNSALTLLLPLKTERKLRDAVTKFSI
jgi:hypothetical protein